MPTKVTKGFLSPISQPFEEMAIGGNHDYVCVVRASRCLISRTENGRSTGTSLIGYSVAFFDAIDTVVTATST